MSDDGSQDVPPGQYPPPGGQQPPNWGSAYPPPPGAYPPPPGYGQGGYPPPGYGYPPPGSYGPPKHPQATTALVIGIVGLAGGFICVLPILASPFAWFIGAKTVREIDQNPTIYSGRGDANAGKITGIIGTALLVLGLLGLAALITVGVASS